MAKPRKPEAKGDFPAVFAELKRIMRKYEGRGLEPQPEKNGEYILAGPPTERSQGREVWFGGVRLGKAYVSYHLMPVYAFPELLAGVSPELRKRMQGKSCFNFQRVDPRLFEEIDVLTEAGYRRFQEESLILRDGRL